MNKYEQNESKIAYTIVLYIDMQVDIYKQLV